MMTLRQTATASIACIAIMLLIWGISSVLHHFGIYESGVISAIWLATYLCIFALYALIPLLFFQLLRLALRKKRERNRNRDERIK